MERWSFVEVDTKLFGIMKNIFNAAYDTSVEFGKPGDLVMGANIAGFIKVADSMIDEGAV
jgi:glutamate dehydrogenase/leucine dehydrogenase